MANSEIQKLVDTFVSHLEAEIRSAALVAVQAALSGVSVKAAASPKAPAKLVAKAAAKPAVKPAAKPAAAKPAVAKPAATVAKPAAAKPATKPAAAKSTLRVRRSPADIDRDVGRLTGYVRANQGITSEKARAVLQFDKTIWTQTLRRAVDTQQLSTKGEKRNTTLHVPGPTPPVRR